MSEDQMKPNEAEAEVPPEEPKPEPAKWEHKSEFAVVGHMREVVKLTMAATENEIQALHRKLERLQYGS